MAVWAPPPEPPHPPTHPPTLREKEKTIKRTRNWRSIFATQPFFLASDPPPPPVPATVAITPWPGSETLDFPQTQTTHTTSATHPHHLSNAPADLPAPWGWMTNPARWITARTSPSWGGTAGRSTDWDLISSVPSSSSWRATRSTKSLRGAGEGAGGTPGLRCRPPPRAVPNGKKFFPEPVFPKKPAGTPCAQPWLVAVGGWRLAAGNWRLVAVGGGWRRLVVGDWWLVAVGSWRLVAAGGWRRLVVGGWWRLAVDGSWRLAVDGSWRLAVGGPLGRSLRAVLSKKKKSGPLRTALPPPPPSSPAAPLPKPQPHASGGHWDGVRVEAPTGLCCQGNAPGPALQQRAAEALPEAR